MGLPLFPRLVVCATLTLALMVAELVLGHFTHSVSLLALTNQSMYNLLSLAISASAAAISKSNAKTLLKKTTFGWPRIDVVGSLASLVFLASLCFGTAIEALQTLTHSGHLDVMHQPVNVCILALIHFLVWFAVFGLIGGYSHHQRRAIQHCRVSDNDDNVCVEIEKRNEEDMAATRRRYKSPTLADIKIIDIFRDLASCFLLVVTTVGVYYIDEEKYPRAIKYVDPCVALISIGILVACSVSLAGKLAHILLQGIPQHLSVKHLIKDILAANSTDIDGIHEFHLWSLAPSEIVATLHVTYKSRESYIRAHTKVQNWLKLRGICRVTVQPEFIKETQRDDAAALTASEKETEVAKDEKSSGETENIPLTQKSTLSQCQLRCRQPICANRRCCDPDKAG